MNLRLFSLSLVSLACLDLGPQALAQAGNDNPGGVTAEYHGTITTAGYYDGPSRTLNYPAASASFVWTDFKNQPYTDSPITTPPGGWQITDPRNNTTTYDLEPVLDRMLAAKRRTSAAIPLSPL